MRDIMKNTLSLLLSRLPHALAVLLLASSTLLAAPAGAADKTPDDAKAFIQNLAQQAIGTVAQRDLSDSERNDRFRRLFVASFDLPQISQFVLARYWRTATPDQQQDFLKLFQEMQVLNWAQRFKDYKGENLSVTNAAKDGDKGFTVDSQINRPSAQPMPVQWKVHVADDGQLRVGDIVVEGVSMAITQRSDYNSMLQGNGGKVDALLTALRTKVDQMRASSGG
jgi:phospholipid transport system substrate-binding protein